METEEYAGACSPVFTEMEQRDGIDLIEKIVDINNLFNACKKVRANKGAPGVDEMTVDELLGHVAKYRTQLIRKLKDGSYEPLPVKRVEIPKLDGSMRKLGIPCVRDRMVQQAIYQV
ncbi:DNA polymerase, partial [Lederbergia galactosidilytica]